MVMLAGQVAVVAVVGLMVSALLRLDLLPGRALVFAADELICGRKVRVRWPALTVGQEGEKEREVREETAWSRKVQQGGARSSGRESLGDGEGRCAG